MKEQMNGDSAAKHFGQVTRGNRNFARQPIRQSGPAGVVVAACLGQVLAGDDAQPRRTDLHEDGHQARQRHHPEKSVAVLGAGLEVGRPVAGVHVADADEEGRAGEGPTLAPKTGGRRRHRNGVMQAFQRRRSGRRSRL